MGLKKNGEDEEEKNGHRIVIVPKGRGDPAKGKEDELWGLDDAERDIYTYWHDKAKEDKSLIVLAVRNLKDANQQIKDTLGKDGKLSELIIGGHGAGVSVGENGLEAKYGPIIGGRQYSADRLNSAEDVMNLLEGINRTKTGHIEFDSCNTGYRDKFLSDVNKKLKWDVTAYKGGIPRAKDKSGTWHRYPIASRIPGTINGKKISNERRKELQSQYTSAGRVQYKNGNVIETTLPHALTQNPHPRYYRHNLMMNEGHANMIQTVNKGEPQAYKTNVYESNIDFGARLHTFQEE